MQEQLARNKELTQKACLVSDSDEDGNSSEAEKGLIPDVVNEGHAGVDPDNPWMLGKSREESKEDPPAPEEGAQSEEEEEAPVSEEEALLQSFAERRQGLQGSQDSAAPQGELAEGGEGALPACAWSPAVSRELGSAKGFLLAWKRFGIAPQG